MSLLVPCPSPALMTCIFSVVQGKVELELEVVTLEEEQIRPAGKAREDPNDNPKLDPPK